MNNRRASLTFLFLIVPQLGAQPMVLDPGFAPAVEAGYSVVGTARYIPAPDRRLIVLSGSNSTYVNDVAHRHGIARLLPDGTRDTSFTAQLTSDEIVRDAFALADQRLLVSADSSPGEGAGRLIRLLANGQIDPSFSPTSVVGAGSIRLTRLSDGSAIVWGRFDSIGGVARNGLARVLTDGSVDPTFAPALSDAPLEVASLVAAPDDRVIVSAVSYSPTLGERRVFSRLTSTGAIDPSFAPAPPSTTFTKVACLEDHRLLVAHGELRRLNPDGSLDSTFVPQIPQVQYVRNALVLPGGRIAVEADTGLPNAETIKSVFILKPDGALERDARDLGGAERIQFLRCVLSDGSIAIVQGPLIWQLGPWPEFSAYYVPGMAPPTVGLIDPPGRGYYVPGMATPRVGLIDPAGQTLSMLPTAIESTGSSNISRLALDADGRILAEGNFTRIAGAPRAGSARFNPDGTLDPAFVPPAATPLFHQPDGRTIVSQSALGPADATGFHAYVTRVVRLNADGTVDPTFVPAGDLDLLNADWLASAPDGRILVCVFAGGVASDQNAKLIWLDENGGRSATLSTTFSGLGSGSYHLVWGSPFAVQHAAILSDGKLLLGVRAPIINGLPNTHLVRLNPDGSTDATYRPSFTPLLTVDGAQPLPDGRALVQGTRLVDGIVRYNAVLRLKPDGSPDTFVEPASLRGLPLADGSYLHETARFHPDGTPDLNYNLPIDHGYQLRSAVLARDGSLWIGGFFVRIGDQPRNGFARLVPAEEAGFTVQPATQRAVAGLDVTLRAELGTAAVATFQWTFNGVPIAGATGRTLRLVAPGRSAAGEYCLVATVGGTTHTSEPATLTVEPNTTRLVNFSARSIVAPGYPPQIGGFVLRSAVPRPILLRAVGRGLPVDIPGLPLLPAPRLAINRGATLIAQDAGSALATAISDVARTVGAFPLRSHFPANEPTRDSAVLLPLASGAYTAHVTSADGQSGVSLFEFYDTDVGNGSPATTNLSVRGHAATGDGVLIAGFVIEGNARLRLLIRAVGPALEAFGVDEFVADPRITLYRQDTVFAFNNDWSDQVDVADLSRATQRVGAFPLPEGSRDAALLVSLAPGIYTVHGGVADSSGGELLIELYALQD